ncbi:MAG: ABC transporter substrate-binding protein [Chloroflexi bacterium]|nr:ABC transporter substrate-binding protein [Chloroflexota bacterium]
MSKEGYMLFRLTTAKRLMAVVLVATGLAVACGPAAAPTATAPPPTPTKAAATVAAPTATATPVPAAPKRGGKITWAATGEPALMSASAATTDGVTGPLSGYLAYRNANTGAVDPDLAEKWEMKDIKNWRFYLKKGVKFWNGEAFTPEGIISDLEWQSNPVNKSRLPRYIQSATGTVVDPYTVDINCSTPCPTLPMGVYHLKFQAPQWAKANPNLYTGTTLSNGPYKLAEYKRGEYITLTRYEGYIGALSPTLDEATIVWRAESKVRAAMVATGEANVAQMISIADSKLVPKTVNVGIGVENAMMRLNSRADPLMKDKRVRQALAYAIDRDTITKTLLQGLTKPKDLTFAPGSVGWTETNITRYPYDPAKARQLIKDAGFEGGKITAPSGTRETLDNEIYQAIMGYIEAVGLKTQIIPLEGLQAQQIWSVGVGLTSPYSFSWLLGHTNDQFDAKVTLNYADCRQAYSYWRCDPDEQKSFQAKLDDASAAVGAERQKKMADLMTWFTDEPVLISLWGTPYFHGLRADTAFPTTNSFSSAVVIADVRLTQ